MVRRHRRHGMRRAGKRGKVSMSTKKYVKRVLNANIETKYVDITVSGTATSSAFYALQLTNSISQGTSRGNRIGARIKVTGLRYLLEVQPGDNENVCRTFMAAYRPGGTTGSTASIIPALLGMANTDTFRIHKDFLHEARFTPVDGSTSATVGINKYYRGFIPLKYRLNYGAGASSVENALLLQFHSDSAIAPNPGITGQIRIYFKDA